MDAMSLTNQSYERALAEQKVMAERAAFVGSITRSTPSTTGNKDFEAIAGESPLVSAFQLQGNLLERFSDLLGVLGHKLEETVLRPDVPTNQAANGVPAPGPRSMMTSLVEAHNQRVRGMIERCENLLNRLEF
jgi:hypothetical protein